VSAGCLSSMRTPSFQSSHETVVSTRVECDMGGLRGRRGLPAGRHCCQVLRAIKYLARQHRSSDPARSARSSRIEFRESGEAHVGAGNHPSLSVAATVRVGVAAASTTRPHPRSPRGRNDGALRGHSVRPMWGVGSRSSGCRGLCVDACPVRRESPEIGSSACPFCRTPAQGSRRARCARQRSVPEVA
jgi:hypothetical protein